MSKKSKRRQPEWIDPDLTDEELEVNDRWGRLEPDEREDYEDWRRDRGSRGRKPRGKAGDRHHRRRWRDDEA